jgi:hypothetical protein
MPRNRQLIGSAVVTCSVVLSSVLMSATTGATEYGHFKNPGAMAFDGHGHLWIANQDKWGITEVDVATGKVMHVFYGKQYDFLDPSGIAVDRNNIWVVNEGFFYDNGSDPTGTIDELSDKTGALIRRMDLQSRHVTGLAGVSAVGPFVWVTSSGGAHVVKISNATGKVLHIYGPGHPYGTSYAYNVIDDGTHVWLPSPFTNGHIVERNAVTGNFIRTLSSSHWFRTPGLEYKSKLSLQPYLVTDTGTALWSANSQGITSHIVRDSASEYSLATGKVIRSVGTFAYRITDPIGICSDQYDVWILNGEVGFKKHQYGDTVTELNAKTGALVRVIRHAGLGFTFASGIATNGVDLFVSSQTIAAGNHILEFNAATGALVRSID